MEAWRKRGAFGKCHNFAYLTYSSPQRLEKWLTVSKVRIPRDNITRWGSIKRLIGVFLKLRSSYEKWWLRFPNEFNEAKKLSDREWIQLKKLYQFLKTLADTTDFLESNSATLERVLPTMEYILGHFERGKVSSLHSFTINHCLTLLF